MADKSNPMMVIVNGENAKVYDHGEAIATVEEFDSEKHYVKTTLINEGMSWYYTSFTSAVYGLKEALVVLYSDDLYYEIREVEDYYARIRKCGDSVSDTVIEDAIKTFDLLVDVLQMEDLDITANYGNIEFNHKTDNLNWFSVIVNTDGHVEIDSFVDGSLIIKNYPLNEVKDQDLL